MAWSSAALASRETTDFAADKPLVAVQKIPVSPTYAKWVDGGQLGADDLPLWTDRTDSDFPIKCAYDGFPDLITKPDATADNDWYLAFDFGEAITFDCAFIIGSNFGTLALTTIDLQVSDDDEFDGGSRLTTVASFSASDDRRADYTMNAGNNRITAQFAWLKLERVANFTPEIGELILGRRRQWQYKPDMPFGDKDLKHTTETIRSEGGRIQKIIYSRRAFPLSCRFPLDSSDYVDDMEGFFEDCRGSFVWVYDPTTSPNAWRLMMLEEDSLIMPMTQPNRYEVDLAALEQGPENFFLSNE